MIANYVLKWVRSKEFESIKLYKDRIKFCKELIDVAALRTYTNIKMRLVLSELVTSFPFRPCILFYLRVCCLYRIRTTYREEYEVMREIVVGEQQDTLSALMPSFDEVLDSGAKDWTSKTLRGLMAFLKANNQTDQQEFLDKTTKCKFGAGWTEVWKKCGGFGQRITK